MQQPCEIKSESPLPLQITFRMGRMVGKQCLPFSRMACLSLKIHFPTLLLLPPLALLSQSSVYFTDFCWELKATRQVGNFSENLMHLAVLGFSSLQPPIPSPLYFTLAKAHLQQRRVFFFYLALNVAAEEQPICSYISRLLFTLRTEAGAWSLKRELSSDFGRLTFTWTLYLLLVFATNT